MKTADAIELLENLSTCEVLYYMGDDHFTLVPGHVPNYSSYQPVEWTVRAGDVVKRVFPPGHHVRADWEQVEGRLKDSYLWGDVPSHRIDEIQARAALGAARQVLFAAQAILESGAASLVDGVRAETVVEVLDQAADLNRGPSPAPVAAAVLAGGALETHLRHVCDRAGLLGGLTGHGSIEKYKGLLDQARNAGNEIISKGDAKQITAWADDRNLAAHTPTKFAKGTEAVALIIEGIRQFITRTSAL